MKNVLNPFLGQLRKADRLEELVKGETSEKILFKMLENAGACLHDDRIITAQEARVHMQEEINLIRKRQERRREIPV